MASTLKDQPSEMRERRQHAAPGGLSRVPLEQAAEERMRRAAVVIVSGAREAQLKRCDA